MRFKFKNIIIKQNFMIDIFNIKLIFDEDVEMIGSESKYI
jgi:hypothetical protein